MLMNSKKFGLIIEGIVKEKRIPYMDAVLQYCEDNEIEIESVSKLISKPLKEKLRFVATELNYMKKTSKGKLPL